MAFLEMFVWTLFGGFLGMTAPGPRGINVFLAAAGGLYGGLFGRALPFQVAIGDFSFSALLIAGIGAVVTLMLARLVTRGDRPRWTERRGW